MSKLLRQLRFWWFRHRSGYPGKAEIEFLMGRMDVFTSRSFQVCIDYTEPRATLESVAEKHNVTHERIRQILWKVWRQNKHLL